MTRSILTLAPALQAVWRETYAATMSGLAGSSLLEPTAKTNELTPTASILASRAENAAWEAVRRANGGALPAEPATAESMVEALAPILAAQQWPGFEDVGTDRRAEILILAREALQDPTCVGRHLAGIAEALIAAWKAAQSAPVLKAAEEFAAISARGGMPCDHTVGDLIGGRGAVTKCGACLAEKQAARTKPAPDLGIEEDE